MNLIDQIISTIEHWQEQLPSPSQESNLPSASMAAMEQAANALAQRIAKLALSHLLELSGTGYDRSFRACICGDKQRFLRYSNRSVRTLMGEISYRRAYYRCHSCGASSFPLDEQLSQSRRDISPLFERVVALLSAHLSFAEVERMLEELTSVSLSARQIETVAESIGAEAEACQQLEDQQSLSVAPAQGVGPNQPPPRTFIVEMDGVQLGLQDGRWQEVKCGVIYELSQRVEISPGRWELLKRYKCALRGDAKAFRRRLWALCLRAGLRQQDRIVVIGDGAEWIDQTQEFLFPRALRILDYYHASERIWAVAAARFGEATKEAKKWAESQLLQLRKGEVEDVIRRMKRLRLKQGEAERIRQSALRYLTNRREQMRYEKYKEEGLPIGSGAIESSCKQIVTARCKQAGMRWSEMGADRILALRSYVLNDRLDELCPKPEISFDWEKAA